MRLFSAATSRSIGVPVGTALSLLLVGLSWCASALADEPTPPETDPPVAKEAGDDRESIDLAARQYKVFLGKDRVELEMERVLRWPNPTRRTPDGATFVWTRDGRPEVIACIWKYDGALWYAFQSLSASSLVAEYGKQPF